MGLPVFGSLTVVSVPQRSCGNNVVVCERVHEWVNDRM